MVIVILEGGYLFVKYNEVVENKGSKLEIYFICLDIRCYSMKDINWYNSVRFYYWEDILVFIMRNKILNFVIVD